MDVHRVALGKPLLAPQDADIVAIASDEPITGLALPRFDLNDIEAIAGFVMGHCRLAPSGRKA
jgi:hypothetical protein